MNLPTINKIIKGTPFKGERELVFDLNDVYFSLCENKFTLLARDLADNEQPH